VVLQVLHTALPSHVDSLARMNQAEAKVQATKLGYHMQYRKAWQIRWWVSKFEISNKDWSRMQLRNRQEYQYSSRSQPGLPVIYLLYLAPPNAKRKPAKAHPSSPRSHIPVAGISALLPHPLHRCLRIFLHTSHSRFDPALLIMHVGQRLLVLTILRLKPELYMSRLVCGRLVLLEFRTCATA
jgi:hypothetical protein